MDMADDFDVTSDRFCLRSEIWMCVFALNSNAWEFLKWIYSSKAFTSRPIPFQTWIYAHLLFKLVGKLFAHNEWSIIYLIWNKFGCGSAKRWFFIYFFIQQYQFRRPFFVKNIFFLDSIFERLYFLKLGPIFVGPTLCQFTKYSNCIWPLLIFEQKPCFLGSIKRETPWRNWHYYKN